MRSPEESMEAHDILETVWQQYKQNEGYKKTHNPLQRGASFSFRGLYFDTYLQPSTDFAG